MKKHENKFTLGIDSALFPPARSLPTFATAVKWASPSPFTVTES